MQITNRKPGEEVIPKIKVQVLVDRYVVPGSVAGQVVEVDDTPANREELKVLEKYGQAKLDDGEEVQAGQIETQKAQIAALTTTVSELSAENEILRARLAVYEPPQEEPEEEDDPSQPTPLPDDFPARDKLTGKGYATVEAVRKATDEELNGIQGIGDATLRDIKEALAKLEQA